MPSSWGSSQHRDRTGVSWIAGGFFTVWDTRGKCHWLSLLYTVMCIGFRRKENQLCYIDSFHKGFLKTWDNVSIHLCYLSGILWRHRWAGCFPNHCLVNRVRLFVTPWTAAHQASLSITNSRSLLKLMSMELVMPSNHLILCRPLLLLPSIFPSIRVFSNESPLHIRWPK